MQHARKTAAPLPARVAARGRKWYLDLRLAAIVRQVDTLLVSFPKSGRTWFRFILASYFAESMLVAPVDLYSMFSIIPNFDWDQERGLPAYLGSVGTRREVPLIAVTHKPPDRVTDRARHVTLIVRDPRDVMVSAYFHATRHKHRFTGDIDTFVRDPDQGLRAWVAHTNAWAAAIADRPHHLLTYEALSANPVAETIAMLEELGLEPSLDIARAAVDAAQIDRMRALEIARGLPGHDYDRVDPNALRMRKGVVGGYDAELPRATADWIEDYCGQHGCALVRETLV